ncbi:FAD:protein FMN transferase [Kibdelosporangium philippinense]|uniref:FAD:protein FMN transferase n=1 Tax=Kibdelosporangium philippinense TaxID=211113 RepID=A0ABS8Z6M2_9PSEU|nr:FAD:protein FMN transferase [Kibdelosporangium philippinense]MCE7003531.1 FAD:protein FMN transferase [Kibdelosporangium philippinense]
MITGTRSIAGVKFEAIGTTAHVLVTDPETLPVAETILRWFIHELDLACSRFRDDSALTLLNRTGTATHPLLAKAVEVALRAAADTDGLVDPALGSYMVTLGYDRTFAEVPRRAPEPIDIDAPPKQAWRDIRVSGNSVTVPKGIKVDLGATAKAWAADVAASRIAGETGAGVLVNLGGDIAVAGPAPEDGWSVRVTADHTSDEGGQIVAIDSGGLATSSVTVRTWQRGDAHLHHILNPMTGLPASRIWRYATVSAMTCVAANTASTAALVLGDRAPNWLAARRLPARLVATGGAVTTVAEWPEEE